MPAVFDGPENRFAMTGPGQVNRHGVDRQAVHTWMICLAGGTPTFGTAVSLPNRRDTRQHAVSHHVTLCAQLRCRLTGNIRHYVGFSCAGSPRTRACVTG